MTSRRLLPVLLAALAAAGCGNDAVDPEVARLRAELEKEQRRHTANVASLQREIETIRQKDEERIFGGGIEIKKSTLLQEQVDRLQRELAEVPMSHWLLRLENDGRDPEFIARMLVTVHGAKGEAVRAVLRLGLDERWPHESVLEATAQPSAVEGLLQVAETGSDQERVFALEALRGIGRLAAAAVPRLEALRAKGDLAASVRAALKATITALAPPPR